MNSLICPCHPLYANQRGDCCCNCGQQHFGRIPCFAPPPNNCCCAKPCMMCCSFEGQNIMALFQEYPSRDHIGNRNPAHVLTALTASGSDNNNNNNEDNSEPYCRAYSLASSYVDHDQKIYIAPDPPPEHSSNNPRSYLLSCHTKEMENNAIFDNVPIFPRRTSSIGDQSTTSLNDCNDIINHDQHCVPNSSTIGDVPICEAATLPWLDNITNPNGHGISRQSTMEQLFQQHTGELAELRHNQQEELLHLRKEEPSTQLHSLIEILVDKQLQDQRLLQEKHRRQMAAEEEPVKEYITEGCNTNYDPSLLRTKSLNNNNIINTPNNGRRLSSDCMQHCNDDKRTQTSSYNITSFTRRPNTGFVHANVRQNAGGGVPHCIIHDNDGYNSNGRSNVFPNTAKSSPTVLKKHTCTCNDPKAPCDEHCVAAQSRQSTPQDQHYQGASKHHSDPWREIRMTALETEIVGGQNKRQQIADAMADHTINYKNDVVVRTAEQRTEDATKAYQQRQRNAEAAAHTAALQIEYDSIDATLLWLREAQKAAEERKQIETMAINEARLQEAKLIRLKQKEIELTETAIRRQLAEEEATAVLRRMKDDDLERARQRKHDMLVTKSRHEMDIAEITARRIIAEMAAKDIASMRKHDENEAIKNRTALENAMAQQNAFAEALAIAKAKRREENDVDSNAEHESMLKKAILCRDLEALRAEARRKDAEEKAAAASTWRHEEDALLDQRHKALLQAAANRRKEEEEAIEVQKKQLVEELAKERSEKKHKLQEEQKETVGRLKKRISEDVQNEKTQRKSIEGAHKFHKVHSPPIVTVKRDSVKNNKVEPAKEVKPEKQSIDHSHVVTRVEHNKAQGKISREPSPIHKNQVEPTQKPLEHQVEPTQKPLENHVEPTQKSLENQVEQTQKPLENQSSKVKSKRSIDSRGAPPSAKLIKQAQEMANKAAPKSQTSHIAQPHGKQKSVPLTKSQQKRLSAMRAAK